MMMIMKLLHLKMMLMTLKKKRMKWFQFGIKKNANGTRDTKTKKGSKGKQAKEIVAEYYSDDEEDEYQLMKMKMNCLQ